jgi:adenosine deaminase
MVNLVDHLGFGWDGLRRLTTNAARSAFLPYDERVELIERLIVPGYDALQA